MEQSFIIDCTTNTTEKDDSSIRIFPNPFKGLLTLMSFEDSDSEVTFTIFSQNGAKVKEGSFINLQTLDLSSIETGVYFIELILEDRQVVRKVIKH